MDKVKPNYRKDPDRGRLMKRFHTKIDGDGQKKKMRPYKRKPKHPEKWDE